MKKHMIAGLMLAATSTTAFAQDTKHFDGGFVGAEIGYFSSGRLTQSDQNQNGSADGIYYGGNIGYRVQTDSNFVYGIEGAFGKSDVDLLFLGDEDDFDLNDIVDRQWHVMGTVGWATGNDSRNLFSVGAGYTEITTTFFSSSSSNGNIAAQAAYERAIGSNLSLRVKATTYEFDTVIGTVGLALRF